MDGCAWYPKFNALRKYLSTPILKNSNSRKRRLLLQLLLTIFGTTALFPRLGLGRQKDSTSSATVSSGIGSTLHADLLLYNGKIITLDNGSRISEAVAIRGTKILAVGEDANLKKHVSPETRRVDLKGRTVLPGFFDAHPHMDREGLKTLGGESLVGANSVSAIVERVAEAARKARPGEWIVFMPMGAPPFDYVNDAKMLKEGRFPNRHDLDRVAPDNPVYIRSVWGWWTRPPFPAVANSEAMRRCGIAAATADPYNIEIVRDSSGNPIGVFLETNRTPLLEFTLFRYVPRFTYEDRLESVRIGSEIYSALGTDNVPPSMLFTAWEALERWDETGQRHLGESHLTREEVLRISCQAPHYMNWEEDNRGKIAEGMAAELAVFDTDPLTCDIKQLPKLKPAMTMVDGRIVHDNDAGAAQTAK